MSEAELLAERLEEAGFAVASLEAVRGASMGIARVAVLRDGRQVFAKTLAETDAGLFEVEAAGLSALCELGAIIIGGKLGGLNGLCLAYTAVLFLEGLATGGQAGTSSSIAPHRASSRSKGRGDSKTTRAPRCLSTAA